MKRIVLLLILLECACSQRRRYSYYDPYYQYYGLYRQRASSAPSAGSRQAIQNVQRDAPVKRLQGKNVCIIKEIFGTGERFYEEFTGEIPNKVCGRITFVRRKCCAGYGNSESGGVCTSMKPLKSLLETAKNLRLHTFIRLLTNTQLGEQLDKSGAFTLFVPTDKAFRNITHGDRQRLHPWTYNAPSLLHYHVINGRHNYTQFKDVEHETLYYGRKPIRINKYRHGIYTVNCARILRPNQVAHNGIIHVIDRMLKPLDIQGDVSSFIMRDPRFTQFGRVLYAADMVNNFFRDNVLHTLFAPDDKAMARIPKELSRRIFYDKKVAQAIVKHHTVAGIHCGAATINAHALESLQGGSLTFSCRYNGNYIQNARVKEADLMVANGVIHVISRVLLPNIVKTTQEMLRDLGTKTMIDLIDKAGIQHNLFLKTTYTLFVPSDDAFAVLPSSHLKALESEPGMVEKMLSYHMLPSKLLHNDWIHGQTFQTTMTGTHVKVNVFRTGVLINDARIVKSDLQSSNAVVHIIDKVLVPPEHSLLDLVGRDPALRDFLKYCTLVGITDILNNKTSQMTIFAPSNDAWNKMDRKLFSNKKLLKQYLLRHFVNDIILSTAIPSGDSYVVHSIQSESISVKKDGNTIFVNKHSKAVSMDQIASNGFLFVLDQVIYCKCKSGL